MKLSDSKNALDIVFSEYLREYQREYLRDFSVRRVVLKSRRIGLSWVAALDVLLTTSGIWEAIGAPVYTHNYNVISKRDTEAKQFIRYIKSWKEILDLDPALAPYLETTEDGYSATHITFKRSGFRIQSDTQSPAAGRGAEGNLLKDESAWYPYATEIVAGADKVPQSDPRLRLTEISTPNGTSGPGEVFWRKHTEAQFDNYSRHTFDIYRAFADGFPLDPEDARRECLTEDEFRQEYCCAFNAGAREYFARHLIEGALVPLPTGNPELKVLGIDVASENDLTAVVALTRHGAATWMHTPKLVSGVPYASSPGVRGQEEIVAQIILQEQPDAVIIDASGDGAELFGRLLPRIGSIKLIPHSFHKGGRQWKDTFVPMMRHAMEQGTLHFADLHALALMRNEWQRTRRPVFAEHFLQIERKLLETGPTFSSPRTSEGHADSFWAAVMAFSVVINSEVSPQQDALKSLLRSSHEGRGNSYGDYL